MHPGTHNNNVSDENLRSLLAFAFTSLLLEVSKTDADHYQLYVYSQHTDVEGKPRTYKANEPDAVARPSPLANAPSSHDTVAMRTYKNLLHERVDELHTKRLREIIRWFHEGTLRMAGCLNSQRNPTTETHRSLYDAFVSDLAEKRRSETYIRSTECSKRWHETARIFESTATTRRSKEIKTAACSSSAINSTSSSSRRECVSEMINFFEHHNSDEWSFGAAHDTKLSKGVFLRANCSPLCENRTEQQVHSGGKSQTFAFGATSVGVSPALLLLTHAADCDLDIEIENTAAAEAVGGGGEDLPSSTTTKKVLRIKRGQNLLHATANSFSAHSIIRILREECENIVHSGANRAGGFPCSYAAMCMYDMRKRRERGQLDDDEDPSENSLHHRCGHILAVQREKSELGLLRSHDDVLWVQTTFFPLIEDSRLDEMDHAPPRYHHDHAFEHAVLRCAVGLRRLSIDSLSVEEEEEEKRGCSLGFALFSFVLAYILSTQARDNGDTPLHTAVRKNRLAVVEAILIGSQLETLQLLKTCQLSRALIARNVSSSESSDENLKREKPLAKLFSLSETREVESLISQSLGAQLLFSRNSDGDTPLHVAVSPAVAELILRHARSLSSLPGTIPPSFALMSMPLSPPLLQPRECQSDLSKTSIKQTRNINPQSGFFCIEKEILRAANVYGKTVLGKVIQDLECGGIAGRSSVLSSTFRGWGCSSEGGLTLDDRDDNDAAVLSSGHSTYKKSFRSHSEIVDPITFYLEHGADPNGARIHKVSKQAASARDEGSAVQTHAASQIALEHGNMPALTTMVSFLAAKNACECASFSPNSEGKKQQTSCTPASASPSSRQCKDSCRCVTNSDPHVPIRLPFDLRKWVTRPSDEKIREDLQNSNFEDDDEEDLYGDESSSSSSDHELDEYELQEEVYIAFFGGHNDANATRGNKSNSTTSSSGRWTFEDLGSVEARKEAKRWFESTLFGPENNKGVEAATLINENLPLRQSQSREVEASWQRKPLSVEDQIRPSALYRYLPLTALPLCKGDQNAEVDLQNNAQLQHIYAFCSYAQNHFRFCVELDARSNNKKMVEQNKREEEDNRTSKEPSSQQDNAVSSQLCQRPPPCCFLRYAWGLVRFDADMACSTHVDRHSQAREKQYNYRASDAADGGNPHSHYPPSHNDVVDQNTFSCKHYSSCPQIDRHLVFDFVGSSADHIRHLYAKYANSSGTLNSHHSGDGDGGGASTKLDIDRAWVLYNLRERIYTLKYILKHGADIVSRPSCGSPTTTTIMLPPRNTASCSTRDDSRRLDDLAAKKARLRHMVSVFEASKTDPSFLLTCPLGNSRGVKEGLVDLFLVSSMTVLMDNGADFDDVVERFPSFMKYF